MSRQESHSTEGALVGTPNAGQTPEFDPRVFYNGPIDVWGCIQDRRGNLRTRFRAEMHGSWQGSQGTLKEELTFLDGGGATQRRTWHITQCGEVRYEAVADDLIGTALGEQLGNAMRWRYTMAVPVRGRTIRLQFDDWAWAMPDGVAINRVYMRKFGIRVAELTACMRKR